MRCTCEPCPPCDNSTIGSMAWTPDPKPRGRWILLACTEPAHAECPMHRPAP